MADTEQVEILKKGAAVWNAWRRENKVELVDLSEADLSGVRLIEADLNKAQLIEANLTGANLTMANLIGANLTRADLTGADLQGADLREVDLTRADLTRADLTGADLRGVDLIRVDLRGANLTGAGLTRADLNGAYLQGANLNGAHLVGANVEKARLYETVFADTNLSGTKGLDLCDHQGPSTLDHRTLARSGTLPTKFLRGCGLPDFIIEAYKLTQENLTPSQVTDIAYKIIELRSDPAIQFHSCFISYSSKDDDFARRLHDDLQETGVRCWFAPEDLKIGDKFRNVIEDAVRLHDKVLLILSKASVKSEWVKDEVEAALEKERKRKGKEKVLFPIRIDNAIQRTRQAWASKLRRQRHIGDFTHWKDHDQYAAAFQRLLRDLKA